MKPYAEKAARALGVDSSLLLGSSCTWKRGGGKKWSPIVEVAVITCLISKRIKVGLVDKVATQTLEYHQGVPVQERAAFRAYQDYEQSFNDYVRFLNENPRYNTALNHGGNNEQFIRGIHQAGYATDPQYADKVLRVKAKIDQM